MHIATASPRLNEIHMVRWRDVQLRFDNSEPVGGFVTIREGWSHGETHTPKTGQREVPMSPQLARVMAPYVKGPRDERSDFNR